MRNPRLLAGVAATTLAVATVTIPALSARATDDPSCSTLQSRITAATAGSTITVHGTCTGLALTIDKDLTLTGDPSDGPDELTGGTGDPLITTTGPNNDGATITVADLTLSHSSGGQGEGGSALQSNGCVRLTLTGDTFSANSAPSSIATGGAVHYEASCATGSPSLTITGSHFDGNSAGAEGGALYIDSDDPTTISTSTFTSNSAATNGGAISVNSFLQPATRVSTGAVLTVDSSDFSANNAGSGAAGGAKTYGGAVSVWASDASTTANSVVISNTTFDTNTITAPDAAADTDGGALAVRQHKAGAASGGVVLLSDNTFFANGADHTGAHGGATYVEGWDLHEDSNTYSGNHAVSPATSGDGSGGGAIYVSGDNLSSTHTNHAELYDDVIYASTVGDHASGSAVYGGDPVGTGASAGIVTVRQSTVIANTGNLHGFSAIAASYGVTVINSIVKGNTQTDYDEVGPSLATTSIDHSLYCPSGTEPSGSICADPQLADLAGGDWHETTGSPTVNTGNPVTSAPSSFVPAVAAVDVEGDARDSAPDMGADELGNADLSVTSTTPAPLATGAHATITATVHDLGPFGAGGSAIGFSVSGGGVASFTATSPHGTCEALSCTVGLLSNGGISQVTFDVAFSTAGAKVLHLTVSDRNGDDGSGANSNLDVPIVVTAAPVTSASPTPGKASPTPAGGGASPSTATGTPLKASEVLSLPGSRSCKAGATYKVSLKKPKVGSITTVKVRFDLLTTKKVKGQTKTVTTKGKTGTYTGKALAKKLLTFKNLKRGKISVVVTVVVGGTRSVTSTKTYKAC